MLLKTLLLLVLMIFLGSRSIAAQYFVAPGGSDSSPGTRDEPFATITKAHSVLSLGDTIYVRGGTYALSTTIVLSKSGNANARYHLMAYAGERVLLDFSSMAVSSNNRGIRLSGNYWHIMGLNIKGAGDNGMFISGSHNIVERSTFFENRDTGLQIGSGGSHNRIINCDAYFNVDPTHGDADGFAAKLDVGTGNVFSGCRAWQNSDDGFDGYLRAADNITTRLENCWIFMNGYLPNGRPSNGNGNGFKLGGGDNGNSDSLKHNVTLTHCLAFDNRVKGFDQNNNRGSMTLYNTTGYRNGANYSLNGPVVFGKSITIVNAAALGATGPIASFAVQQTNSWMPQFTVTVDDFVSIDTTGIRDPRKPDGSLPDLPFMRLAQGSDLIDAGTDVGLPFMGSAPDLGAFEYSPTTSVEQDSFSPTSFVVDHNYPNPFNPQTSIRFHLPNAGHASVRIFNSLGQLIVELLNENLSVGTHIVRWEGKGANGVIAPSGSYYAHIQHGASTKTIKLILLR